MLLGLAAMTLAALPGASAALWEAVSVSLRGLRRLRLRRRHRRRYWVVDLRAGRRLPAGGDPEDEPQHQGRDETDEI